MMEMEETFEIALEKVLDYEGGYVDDEIDRGGKTKHGITEKIAREAGYNGNMKDLSLKKAKKIYYQKFWANYSYNQIDNKRIVIEVFEQAVHMGPGTANRHLQEAYNLLSEEEIMVDGIIGPQTLNAINSYGYKDDLLKLLNILQAEKYVQIIRDDKSQKKFIRGWLKRVELRTGREKNINKQGERIKKQAQKIKVLKMILTILGSGFAGVILKLLI